MLDIPDREFLVSVFLMEAWDIVATLEECLPRVDAPEAETVDQVRGLAHRLKGAAALHGFAEVAARAGAIENLVERVPAVTGSSVAALEGLVAGLKSALDAAASRGPGGDRAAPALEPEDGQGRFADLDRYYAANADVAADFGPEATEHLDTMVDSLLALEGGADAGEETATLFRAVHTLKGAAYTVGCRLIGDLAHRIEDLLDAVREGRAALTAGAIDAVFAGVDALRLMLPSPGAPPAGRAAALERAERLLDAAGTATVCTGEAAEKPARAEPPAAVEAALTPRGEVSGRASLRRDEAARAARPSVRVGVDRLDGLMNLASELVVARSRLERRLDQLDRLGELLGLSRSRLAGLAQNVEGRWTRRDLGTASRSAAEVLGELEFNRYDEAGVLARAVAEIGSDVSEIQAELGRLVRDAREEVARVQRLTRGLRAEIARARMVPLGRLFARLAGQVREAARAAGRTVVLETRGEAVEADSAVVEQVADTLLHLVQNAVAHGIEPEEERRAAGKSAHGTITVSAFQRAGALHLEVADDGRGIDTGRVGRWAVERGLVGPETLPLLTEREVLELIFLPGFTTAPAVTAAAGRGVGLDVVRTNVTRLGGTVSVETTVGAGTRFTVKLPLSVAVTDALLVRVGPSVLAVPVPVVKKVLRVSVEQVRAQHGAETVEVEGEPVDLVRLDRVLGLPSDGAGPSLSLLALRAGTETLAASVDEILGKQEIVVKDLGERLHGMGPFSGATVSGEGRVILVLDPGQLLEARRTALEATPAGRSGPSGSDAVGPARTILLVDDSVSVRRVVGQMLERAGFQVVAAADGADALARIAERPVDLVLTDLEMPRVNGYELIRDLRRRTATSGVPVVVLTTRASDRHASLARQLGVRHYLAKPVDEHVLVRVLDSLVPAGADAMADAR